MARYTVRSMENECRELSRRLEDDVGANLAAVKMMLETRLSRCGQPPLECIQSLGEIIGHLADAIKECKRISRRLRPSVLDDIGLEAAIAEVIREFRAFYPVVGVYLETGGPWDELCSDIRTVLYRVVRESLENIGRHSGAQSVNIGLAKSGGWIILQIEDDGCGFDVSAADSGDFLQQGCGIHSMKERVEMVGGSFRVRPRLGKGTLIHASIPLAEA